MPSRCHVRCLFECNLSLKPTRRRQYKHECETNLRVHKPFILQVRSQKVTYKTIVISTLSVWIPIGCALGSLSACALQRANASSFDDRVHDPIDGIDLDLQAMLEDPNWDDCTRMLIHILKIDRDENGDSDVLDLENYRLSLEINDSFLDLVEQRLNEIVSN